MTILHNELFKHLVNLEILMQQEQLWSDSAPTQEALNSELPFAVDTLKIEQWLQFVFIPKMKILIETGQPLPASIAISPVIHITLSKETFPLIIDAVKKIDLLFDEGKS
ncbi:YqcC family protein [Aliiglaciecola sp. NS0011-25]|uniref:YqcC family protein n=1 Tax=Aliiglaciecola sp. NS0011-25 TaxID=3127654 RepID=UPI003341E5FA